MMEEASPPRTTRRRTGNWIWSAGYGRLDGSSCACDDEGDELRLSLPAFSAELSPLLRPPPGGRGERPRLADAPYESLRPELRVALSEYYRVDDMNSYDALVRALGHFTHRHGSSTGSTPTASIGWRPRRAFGRISTWPGCGTTGSGSSSGSPP